MGWKKYKKSFNQNYNPFSSDFDSKKGLNNLATFGYAGVAEVASEALGDLGGNTTRELKRFSDDIQRGFGKMSSLGDDSLTEPEAAATRELYDPRRRSNKKKQQGSLTTGQTDTQPSLIG
jgi:hypothetical protein